MTDLAGELRSVGDAVHAAWQDLQRGENERAQQVLEKAVRVAPNIAVIHYLLGMARLRHPGLFAAAIGSLESAVRLDPAHADYRLALGEALMEAQPRAAILHLVRAVEMGAKSADGYRKLALLLKDEGKLEDALKACEIGLLVCGEAQPGILNSQALALRKMGRSEEALASLRKAEAITPSDVPTLTNLAATLFDLGQVVEARSYSERICQMEPDNAMAHFNLGFALLAQGLYRQGFRELEGRLGLRQMAGVFGNFQQPRWNGSDLQGQRILLHCEQGAGDTLQYVRYAKFVRSRGGLVILRPPSALGRLLRWLDDGAYETVSPDEDPEPDVQCALMSLPMLAGTEIHTIPPPARFKIPEDLRQRWRNVLGPKRAWRVGLVWAGSAKNPNDRNRSFPCRLYSPLLKSQGVEWISLQLGPQAEQLRDFQLDDKIRDVSDELTDYAETAGLLSQLDLVISADTSVAHLAGSLGKPVWMLVPFVTDWRWMYEKGHTSWYPKARVFRQEKAGDWEGVMSRVQHAFAQLVHERLAS